MREVVRHPWASRVSFFDCLLPPKYSWVPTKYTTVNGYGSGHTKFQNDYEVFYDESWGLLFLKEACVVRSQVFKEDPKIYIEVTIVDVSSTGTDEMGVDTWRGNWGCGEWTGRVGSVVKRLVVSLLWTGLNIHNQNKRVTLHSRLPVLVQNTYRNSRVKVLPHTDEFNSYLTFCRFSRFDPRPWDPRLRVETVLLRRWDKFRELTVTGVHSTSVPPKQGGWRDGPNLLSYLFFSETFGISFYVLLSLIITR